jgi:hypothetical protein
LRAVDSKFSANSQHRGLKLNERHGRIDPDHGGGSDAVLLVAGDAMDVQARVSHVVSLLLGFWPRPPNQMPARREVQKKEITNRNRQGGRQMLKVFPLR